VAYLVLVVALLGLVDRDDSWNFDDGAYATQVRVLRDGRGDGSWAYPYLHRDRDPASRFAPVSHSTTTSEGTFPYVKQPAWIEVLRASTALADQVGDPVEDTPGFDNYHGWGRLNAWATLQLALNTVRTFRVENGEATLAWPSPSNASNKQPFRIDHASDLSGDWTTGAVPTNVVFSATNATWSDTMATQKFYRVRVDED
jgi:hypothetical protein